jgi:hypothetical protein
MPVIFPVATSKAAARCGALPTRRGILGRQSRPSFKAEFGGERL